MPFSNAEVRRRLRLRGPSGLSSSTALAHCSLLAHHEEVVDKPLLRPPQDSSLTRRLLRVLYSDRTLGGDLALQPADFDVESVPPSPHGQ